MLIIIIFLMAVFAAYMFGFGLIQSRLDSMPKLLSISLIIIYGALGFGLIAVSLGSFFWAIGAEPSFTEFLAKFYEYFLELL